MVAKLEVTLKTVGCPEVKFVRKRLRVKTPTLKHGKYKGCCVPDVMRHSEEYWNVHVARDPIKFVGSYSLFIAIEKEFEACMEQNRHRDFEIANAFVMERNIARRPVERALDYRYTGDEIIRSATLTGKFFRDRLASGHAPANASLVTRYESGRLQSPHSRDLARYIQQEYRALRYHFLNV